ncbi:MAG TPA: addiction module protein [Ignavibacteria bacterium]|nr:addiction module protein [Ignavibacteria bacterium]
MDKQLINQINKLNSSEKLELLYQIWDSLNDENYQVNEETRVILDERLEKIAEGKVKYTNWDDVKKKYNF